LKFRLCLYAVCLLTLSLNTAQLVHGETMTQQQRESLLDYCFQHAGRPNPIDDLIDKGFLSSSFKGETCLSVNEAHEKEKVRINAELRQKQEATNKENQANIDRYHACLQNKTNEVCEDILDNNNNNSFVTYNDCILNRSTPWKNVSLKTIFSMILDQFSPHSRKIFYLFN
jgi:hypothetical protein